MHSFRVTRLIRLFNHKILHIPTRSVLLIRPGRLGKYSSYSHRISVWLNEQSIHIARACTKQLEFILAQRIRRSLQLFYLYNKLWDERALKLLMKSWRYRLGRNTKEFIMGAVGVTIFNWDDERITDDELHGYSQEIEAIHKLRDATVVCTVCQLRLIIDNPHPNVEYCTCINKPKCAIVNSDTEWQPFIERQDMLIWRRQEPNTSGLYAYKVYGKFSDVTAEEFLQVQVDVDYRKVWDSTAQELEIIDTDPKSLPGEDHRTDIIYWEMIWPRLFSNRDYVYQRRWVVNKENGIVLIVSRVVDHPNAPNRPDTYRVTSYWSYMVIRPSTKLNEPGIEFGLTYFDDPGVNIPSAVTAWVAMSGLPDFLCRMRQAAKNYKKYRDSKTNENKKLCVVEPVIKCNDVEDAIISHDQNNTAFQHKKEVDKIEIHFNNNNNNNNTDDEIENSGGENIVEDNRIDELDENEKEISSEKTAEKQHGLLRYFFFTKLDENRLDVVPLEKEDTFMPTSDS
ncbi:hypothetical protein PV325_013069 [Microctonus aethiopoides]|nr:hypothetical protein PV325_013069 [Microctonus aethiopoides]